MVERSLCMREVRGSIPRISILNLIFYFLFFVKNMSCSLLFEINNDLSHIIGVYVNTIKNKKKLKKEFLNHVEKSLIKSFNIDSRIEGSPRECDITSKDPILYWNPTSNVGQLQWKSRYVWIWLDKRIGSFVSHEFLKLMIRKNKDNGYCCSCMNKCRWKNCPQKGKRWRTLRFPKNVFHLHNMGYYNYKIVMNEVKKKINTSSL